MPGPLRQPKPTGGFASAQIDDARFILNGRLGKVNARGEFFSGAKGEGPPCLLLGGCDTTLPCALWCREWAGRRSRWATRLPGRSGKVCWYCWEWGRRMARAMPIILRKKWRDYGSLRMKQGR